MTKSMKKAISLCLFSMGFVSLMAQSNEFKIDVRKIGAPVQSTMYGIFLKILISVLMEVCMPNLSKTVLSNLKILSEAGHLSEMSVYRPKILVSTVIRIMSRLSYEKELTGTGLDNEGFKGIGIRKGEKYNFSLYARVQSDMPVKLRINLVNSRNDVFEQKEIEVKWQGMEEIHDCPGAGRDGGPFPFAYHDGDERNRRPRTHFTVPAKYFQQSPERYACRFGTGFERPETRSFPLSRRLHRGRDEQGYPLPVEKHDRSGREPSDQHQSLELYVPV